ncbi:MAG: aconitase X catalytic domain-containing protein, partial [Candidatus Hermodarchaeota archaeon]|nr:aconitase X catalytic domain-containing protein [Candidatus Hermodarchaeota archaeon]
KHGYAAQKSMEILNALGEIYEAEHMVPVTSVQIAGVSYANLGEPGLEWLAQMAKDGQVRVLTTLNPAGMDLENWRALGIDPEFAKNQERVVDAFAKMGIITTCTCTPYLVGNLPHFGEHIAWAESSAVCFANSVIGARTNREGGPSALAAALTGFTPRYGYHLDENRQANVTVKVNASITGTAQFGTLGKVIGDLLDSNPDWTIPLISGIARANTDELKAFCASIATYGGTALFHMERLTPSLTRIPKDVQTVSEADIKKAEEDLNEKDAEIDFVSIGCPHASLREIRRIAELVAGKHVQKETWITTARPTKQVAERMGYTEVIEAAGIKFACDTCCVVAPIKGRFTGLCT